MFRLTGRWPRAVVEERLANVSYDDSNVRAILAEVNGRPDPILSAESAFDPGLLRRVAGDCEAAGLDGAARLLRDIAWHVEHGPDDEAST